VSCAGKPLSPDVLSKAQQGCDMALQLDDDKQQVGALFEPCLQHGLALMFWCC
jgi:hypothetical protein